MSDNLAHLLSDYLVKCDSTEDNCLNNMTLDEILNRGNIILVVKHARDTANGIFNWGYGGGGDYFNYDKFSNTNKFSDMTSDQKDKLLNEDEPDTDNHASKYTQFLLSWTLTLSEGEATKCALDDDYSKRRIMDYAFITEPRVFEYMYDLVEKNKITKKLFPNILYVDDFYRTATSAAIYLNKKWDDLPD